MSDFRYDPNRINPNNIDTEVPTYLKWIYGGVGAVLLGGLLAFAFTNQGSQTASNERPGVNTPAQTTGSGGATRPAPMQQKP